jgi:hypothetical protein
MECVFVAFLSIIKKFYVILVVQSKDVTFDFDQTVFVIFIYHFIDALRLLSEYRSNILHSAHQSLQFNFLTPI